MALLDSESNGATPKELPKNTASGTASRVSADAEVASKLFEKVTPADITAAAPPVVEEEGPSTFRRVFSIISNTLFFGALGVGGYFGYYTYRYNSEQLQTMIDATRQDSSNLPAGSVSGLFTAICH